MIAYTQFFGEHAWTKSPVSSNVYASEENDQSHAPIVAAPKYRGEAKRSGLDVGPDFGVLRELAAQGGAFHQPFSADSAMIGNLRRPGFRFGGEMDFHTSSR
jgi:hypothetical protein